MATGVQLTQPLTRPAPLAEATHRVANLASRGPPSGVMLDGPGRVHAPAQWRRIQGNPNTSPKRERFVTGWTASQSDSGLPFACGDNQDGQLGNGTNTGPESCPSDHAAGRLWECRDWQVWRPCLLARKTVLPSRKTAASGVTAWG